MNKNIIALYFFSFICLAVCNRVYVHPFNLFATGQYICDDDTVKEEKELSPEESTYVPPTTECSSFTPEWELIKQKLPNKIQEDTDSYKYIALLINVLGFRLYKTSQKQYSSKNLLLSPLSIFETLSIFNMGGSRHTSVDLQKLLGLGKETDGPKCTSEADGLKVLATLDQFVKLFCFSAGDLQIVRSNWIFVDNGISMSDKFLNGTASFSDLLFVRSVNHSTPSTAKSLINQFVYVRTSGKVRSILKDLDQSSNLQFGTGIQLTGLWPKNYGWQHTGMMDFWNEQGEKISVPMMTHTGQFHYKTDEHKKYSVVKLNVHQNVVMLIIQPVDGNTLHNLESSISLETLSEWMNGLSLTHLKLTIPKIDINESYDLKQALKDLKLDIFEKKFAFRKMSKDELTLGKLLSQVLFESTTKCDGGQAHVQQNNDSTVEEVTVQNPFLLAVLEKNTKTVMFFGRIVNPASRT
ncbi:angiotensinogen [Protopterus annectens]|uniref:angiotensinogen n=1 Tax=Protopterus annectens TaxID=7888 RepID=UPI001CFBAA59|nr:angiotensinogen [Protopterus annectens]XP_043931997.1 angiotensinogen [Protopterus annectens]XP_043932003.1 angiotensinogen [Protopterus annectens]